MNYIDQKFISTLSSRLEGFHRVGANVNFRCPVCGDSKENKSKRRGWLLAGKSHPVFFCHNCPVSMSFSNFIKFIDPTLYREYIFELMQEKNQSSPEKTVQKVKVEIEEIPEVNDYIKDFLDAFTPILSLQEDHPARTYLLDRKIPEDKLKYLYFAENMQDVHKIDKLGKYKKRILDKDSRIILPIWGKNSLIGISCRSLDPCSSKRYLIYKFEEEMPLVFGLYDINGNLIIDPKKPIIVVEGAIDSLFLDNGISVNGADLKRVMKMLSGLQLIFSPDNEPRNKQICKVYKQIIQSNNNIVIFPDFIEQKDINDMVKNMGLDKVKELINSSIYKGPASMLRFNSWKKC